MNEIDQKSQSSALLDQLTNAGLDVEALMALEKAQQDAQLASRRELLRQRRKNKKNEELEKERLEERTKQMQLADLAEAQASEKFIREVFKSSAGDDQAEALIDEPQSTRAAAQAKRAQVLNEHLADQDFERLGNLLAKQMIEKEQHLKLLLGKYADQKLAETGHVKGRFRSEYALLEDLRERNQIEEASARDCRKKLAVEEANLIREVGLGLDKAYKEEEAALKADMDKRHTEEQIALQQAQVEANYKLRKELLGEQEAAEEKSLDTKALEKFYAVKQQEQEKRQRQNEQQRRAIQKQIEA